MGINDTDKWNLTQNNNGLHFKKVKAGDTTIYPLKMTNVGNIGIGLNDIEIPVEKLVVNGDIRSNNLILNNKLKVEGTTSQQILIADGNTFHSREIIGDVSL